MTNYEKMIAELTPEGDEPFWDENDTISSVFRKAQELQAKHDRNVVRRYRDEELPPDTGRTVIKKIAPEYFEEVRLGYKNFELRKDENNIQPGDTLVLEEYIIGRYPPFTSHYTGRSVERRVKYVLRNVKELGLEVGYCNIGS